MCVDVSEVTCETVNVCVKVSFKSRLTGILYGSLHLYRPGICKVYCKNVCKSVCVCEQGLKVCVRVCFSNPDLLGYCMDLCTCCRPGIYIL